MAGLSVNAEILVVEDDSLIAYAIEQQLLEAGWRVLGVADCADTALHLVETLCPALVLMDIHLKGSVDGVDAAAMIQARHGPPVIFLTGQSDPETMLRARAVKPAGIVLKPWSPGVLRRIITSVLQSQPGRCGDQEPSRPH